MLVTEQPIFSHFWYPILPIEHLSDRPQTFELLGKNLVVWLTAAGTPAVALDRCCHRSARLSLGKVEAGNIVCPYHGWVFASNGACVHVPQLPQGKPIPKVYAISSYQATERYGYVWVALEEPLYPIPEIPEATDPTFRLIHEFFEPWKVSGLRVMENEFDLAHPTFVHTTTFGSTDHPTPEVLEVSETDRGIRAFGKLGVVNPPAQQQNLNIDAGITYRTLEMEWYAPFTCRVRINYPNGKVHVVVNTMTPIDAYTSQMVQFCLRNDTEAETKATDAIAFDRAVTLEDKAILESTDPDIPLEVGEEEHMATDRPGILMRKKLAEMIKSFAVHAN